MRLINGPGAPGAISEIVAKGGENQECGAHSLFLGQVRRDEADGKFVKAIDYSAFEEMVIMEADKIKKSILSEFNDVKAIEIVHSKGLVKSGEISLLVMVSAGHRDHASKACAKVVELIKEKLPIWKKVIFEDDSDQWKQNE
ncbi:MAG: molybdenum cofactor biosynthesis protein MoaE [Bacteroidia bacterium]|nr:MAG: molybdenum cofactor biosynthesis protein MoaE [Bacteroidia bacterium]